MMKGKHIILGICGGIAAYKSVYLLRLLVKAGAEVQVVITPAGKEFITPVTLSSLSGKPVISEFFTANTGSWNSHVDLGLWADAMIIAPATASTIGKMANGIADNMLVTTYLSAKCPIFLAPAMDLDMMAHPSTKRNLELLASYGNYIIEPAVVKAVEAYFSSQCDLKGRSVMITAGPTYERIDPVRFIGNYSSGKMGYAIAEECARRGAEVTLVSGPVSLKCSNPRINRIDVESAREMLAAADEAFATSDVAIMCAAVADYYVENRATTKIKREKDEIPQIVLKRNPDIAATLGAKKRPGQLLVGFALETDNEAVNAKSKIERKNLDFIVLNSLRDKDACFGTDTNKVTIIAADGAEKPFALKPKSEVARDIVDVVVSRLR